MAATTSHPAVAAVKRSFEAAPSDGDDTELEQREETDVGTDKEPDSKPAPPVDPKARYKSLKIRTISTIAVLAITGAFIYSGHVPLMCLVIVLQVLITKEIFAMGTVAQKERRLPWFRAQQWYFYFVANFFLYLRFIKNNLLVELGSDHRLARLGYLILKHHSFISYSLYMAGFVTFVLSLKRNMYVYQFTQYAWTHMIMLVVLVPSTFLVSNIFVGIMWFLFPCYLIVMNDIAAYLAGFFFGRTPLIQLSPKKTWEGFIGGALTTIGAAYLLGGFMSQFDWMICPRLDLSVFGPLHCEREALYVPRRFTLGDVSGALPHSLTEYVATLAALALPPPVVERLAALSFVAMPMQLHAMVLALFASLIAPFGGFFASGFKRAFKQKDFGDTIPGHGGITDRFDCQIIMGMFAYIYYWNCAAAPQVSVGEVLHTALKLGDAAQVELFVKLGNLLVGEGLLPESVGKTLTRVMSAAAPS